MTNQISEIESTYSSLCNLLYANRLKEALNKLQSLMEGMHIADYILQYEDIDKTYRFLLEYNFRGVPDPQRDTIFNKLKISLLELADKVRQQALAQTGMHIYQLKAQIEKEKEIAKEEAAKKIDNLSFELEFTRLLNEAELAASADESSGTIVISPGLFQLMWLSEKYNEADIQLIKAIRLSNSLPWFEKCVAVSAITLSLINCFDKEKFLALFDFYEDRQHQVWQRALAGLIIALMIYDKRINLYPSVKQRFDLLGQSDSFSTEVNNLLIQFLKALETEKLTRKFRDEILPDVQKLESKIREKLDIDNIINNEMIEDKNPDWEQIFEDSPDLLNKIEKMSEMQMDGLDLFMGTFAMLKNFDFFREISNWFRPFYKENIEAANSLNNDFEGKVEFLKGLEDSFYMCNSDKYSFCFNIKHLPEEQSKNIIALFNMEANSMREISQEDGLLNKSAFNTHIYTQYVQDLYRFFKLFPFRNDFRDIFSLQWDITDSWLIHNLNDPTPIIRTSAEFLFSKEHYAEAAGLFEVLIKQTEPEQAVLEKIAFCYQMLGNYKLAVEYYQKSEIFETNRIWTLKKIIYCLRKIGEVDKALKWSQEAAALAPADPYVQIMLGNCFFDQHEFEKAIEHYFKVEFLDPGNKKVLRPIAWCSFVLGKFDIARNYLINLVEQKESTANDLMNLGHIELCSGNKSKAMEYYLASVSTAGMNMTQFAESLRFDTPYLIKNNIDAFEIQLIIDYLRFR